MAQGTVEVIQQGPKCFVGKVKHSKDQNSHSLKNFLIGLGLTIDSYDFNSRTYQVFLPVDSSKRKQVVKKIEGFI